MPQPRISRPRLNTWENFKRKLFEALKETLVRVQSQSGSLRIEKDLNLTFYQCFRAVHREMKLSRDYLPVREGQNPPLENDEIDDPRLEKRPDFFWEFQGDDYFEGYDLRRFVIECKRLGTPERYDRVFNQNYVHNGIVRFLHEDWGYAKGDDEGAMIGYVQTMELQDILDEVNATGSSITQHLIPSLTLSSNSWNKDGISELTHTLDRSFIQSPFVLNHFWIDLRSSYSSSLSTSSTPSPNQKRKIQTSNRPAVKTTKSKNRSNS